MEFSFNVESLFGIQSGGIIVVTGDQLKRSGGNEIQQVIDAMGDASARVSDIIVTFQAQKLP